MEGRTRFNAPGSTFPFTHGFSHILSILFTPFKVYIRTHLEITGQWKSTLSLAWRFTLHEQDCCELRGRPSTKTGSIVASLALF